jgi:uncharacterized protein YoxC
MAANSDDLLISVSTDLTAVKRQLAQLTRDITASASGITKQFDGMGKAIDASMTPMQKRINAMMGIPVPSKVKEWKGALAEAGNELEKTGHAAGATSTSMQAMLHSIRSVGEQLALGVSPAEALTGQLSHLSYVASQPGGVGAALKDIGSKAAALVTAFPEVAAAAAIGAAAFAAYEIFAADKVKSVDEVLKQHEENIKRLGPAYESALPAAIKLLDVSERLANARLRVDAADALKARVAEAQTAIENIVKSEGVFSTRFSGAKVAIDAFMASIKDGNPAAEKFQQTIADLQASGAITEKSMQDLLSASDAAAKAEEALRGIKDHVDAAAKAIADMSNSLGSELTSRLSNLSDEQRKYIEDLIQQLASGKISAEHFREALASLSGVTPDFSGAIASVSGLADQLERAQKAALGLANTTPKTGRLGYDPMADAQSKYKDSLEMWRRFGHDNDSGIDPNKPKATKNHGSKTPAITAADQFNNDLQAIKDRTAALAEEQAMLGKSYEAQEKRKTALQLEQTALKQVREEARKKGDADWQNAKLTPEQISKINATSEAYARQAESLRKAQEAQQEFESWMNVGRDATRGFIDDLLNGATAGEAFANVLKKISSQLLDLAMNDLFGKGGNSGFGLIGSLLGMGGGGGAFPGGGSLNSFGGLYADGGYTGPGGKNDPAGIVHKGEVVWSQDDIRKAGGLASVESMRSRGGAMPPVMPKLVMSGGGGNVTAPVNISIDARGADREGLSRVEGQLARLKSEIPSRVVMAVRDANKTNVKFR